ncbi:hypothetical protein KIPB_016665, partial [Kipferlia bialata]|eukprot:g16665.t1
MYDTLKVTLGDSTDSTSRRALSQVVISTEVND